MRLRWDSSPRTSPAPTPTPRTWSLGQSGVLQADSVLELLFFLSNSVFFPTHLVRNMMWEEAESQGRQGITFRQTQAKPAWGVPHQTLGCHHSCTMLGIDSEPSGSREWMP